MLRMHCVSKKYRHRGQVVTALDQAHVTIARGDFVSLVGPSGSGKSTLLLMLGGMLSPTSGEVYLDEQQERAAALLERVGLGQRLHHKPCELSVGQQQRVALARMLANDPAVVLADEPTGNLDPETSQQIMEFFEQINEEGKTIVMVTHDPQAAARSRRILRLASGQIVTEENPHSQLHVA